MDDPIILIASVTPIICLVLLGAVVFLFYRLRNIKGRYEPIINLDEAIERAKSELARLADAKESAGAELTKTEKARTELKKEIALLEENLEDISFGLYKPHFTFESSEGYKRKLEEIREREKELVHSGNAATCSSKWSVGGSEKEGAKMARQNMKLVLRAFNGECDAAVAKATWNNIAKMEERIRKAFDTINSLSSVLNVSITKSFLNIKLDELRCTYEYVEKKHQELEEQRRIRDEMREEEKAQRELQNARIAAEREEQRFEKALELARQEAEHATGEKMSKLNEQIRILENKLQEAHAQKERAISQAQLTKSGNVYVISNIGSFGEAVYKIGMTRRLDPMDRIRELGDASVPFPFDVHAIIYSENAPQLENNLHNILRDHSINLVNQRKEFFNVQLEEVEKHARRFGAKVEFTKIAEAREYRESVALKAKGVIPPELDEPPQEDHSFDVDGDLVIQTDRN